MAHFAKVLNNIVTDVIVADQTYIDELKTKFGSLDTWIQTSYNTRGGVHYDPETNQPDGGIALRKNYAGVGFTYDSEKDAFIPPKKFHSWTLNESTCLWEAPIPIPNDGGKYEWNEDERNWVPLNHE